MDAKLISSILKTDPNTKKWFQGFSTPDLDLPSSSHDKKKKPSSTELFILNTDSYKGPGIHWCTAIFPSGKNYCEFFDPLGKHPAEYKFEKPLFKKCDVIRFQEFPVQASESSTCGHHCLFFAFHRSRGLSMKSVIKKYSSRNLIKNDKMVQHFVNKNFKRMCRE